MNFKVKKTSCVRGLFSLYCRRNKGETTWETILTTENHIGELEELVLLAIMKIGSVAYGASIQEALEDAGRFVSFGALYTTLGRLEQKGFVSSRIGEATKARGGRAKKYFQVEGAGKFATISAENMRRKLLMKPALA